MQRSKRRTFILDAAGYGLALVALATAYLLCAMILFRWWPL